MGRSGYTDDYDDDGRLNCWRGAVASAIRGERGQALLRDMLAALDALPYPRLIAGKLLADCGVCALGAVGAARGLDLLTVDPYDREAIAEALNIAEPLAAEIAYVNDDYGPPETPEARFARVRAWVVTQLRQEKP